MSAEQLATRILAEQTGIASSMIRRGGIKQDEFERIRDYTIKLEHLPLYVDETGGLSISQLTARARRLKRQKGLDMALPRASWGSASAFTPANSALASSVIPIGI